MRKTLKDILYGSSLLSTQGDLDREVTKIVSDSRQAVEGTVFVAIKGTVVDAHTFIEQVIEQGCTMIVGEEDRTDVPSHIAYVQVKSSSFALGNMASQFYDEPSTKLTLVGVTGTNGKTTITTLLHKLFTKLGYEVGLLSTVVNKVGEKEIPSTHTTPDPISLNALLAEMVDEGCSYCFMEVSSHAIEQGRIAGLSFAGGVFTNITHDHLDYHKTFKNYLNAKKKFFDALPSEAFALTNVDDKNGMVMLQNTLANKKTYGLKNMADIKVKVLENQFSGLLLNLDGFELWSKLIGDFNAYNLAAVYGVSQLLEQDKMQALAHISALESVDGRFQYVQSAQGVTAIVDYAHTPDALENVLKTVANIRTRNETVFTVLGCGGDRDKAKRPIMARVACELSDKVLITSDNPRSEDPNQIIADMMEGVEAQYFNKSLSISDRYQAIKTAVSMAVPGDIILVAGKGHEKYQEISGVRHHFDDLETVLELFKKLNK